MKLNHKKIIIISFIGMLVCYLTAFAVGGGKNSSTNIKVNVTTGENAETIHKIFENLNHVSLDVAAPQANVYLTQSENKDVSITVEKNSSVCILDIKNNNGNITIKYGENEDFSILDLGSSNNCEAKINISVPKNSNIIVKTVSGNIKAQGDYSSAQMTTVSGDIKVDGQNDTASFHSVSGDIKIKGMNKHLAVQSVSGDMKIDYDAKPVDADLNTKTVSGTVWLRLPKDSELNYKFHSVSGLFSSKEIAVKDNAKFFINSESVSGGVNINSTY